MAKFRTSLLSKLLPSLLFGVLCFSPLQADELELVLQAGHQGTVTDAVWLDNVHIMSSSSDGSVKVWDTDTKRVKRTLWHPKQGDTHSGVDDLVATKDGVWALYQDKSLVLWSANGKSLKVSEPFSDDAGLGTQVAVASTGEFYLHGEYQPITIWDPKSDQIKRIEVRGGTKALTVSPDGKKVAFVSQSEVRLSLSSPEAKLPSSFANRWGVDSLLFDDDSDTLFVGTSVNWVEAWRVSDQKLLFRVPMKESAPPQKDLEGQGYHGENLGLGLAPFDSENFLVQTVNGETYSLNKKTGKMKVMGKFPRIGVERIEVSPDKSAIVGSNETYSANESVRVVQLDGDDHTTKELGGRSVSSSRLAIQDNKLFMTSRHTTVSSLDLSSGQPHRRYETGYFPTIATGKNRLYCGGNDGVLHAYEIDSGKELWQRELTTGKARYGFGPNVMELDITGQKLAVSVKEHVNRIEIIDTTTGKALDTIKLDNRSVGKLGFSTDSSKLFYSLGREVSLYDLGYHKSIHSWKLRGSKLADVIAIVPHPIKSAMLIIDRDGRLVTINPSRLDVEPELARIRNIPRIINARVEGSKLLVSAGRRSYLCDTNGNITKTFGAHATQITDALFIGNSVISTGLDSRIHLWNRSDSSPQLSVVTLDEGKEWLAIAPDYRFDGSEGAQDLIEWRWNDELFRVSRFYEKFYQPGLLARIINPEAGNQEKVISVSKSLGDMPPSVHLAKPKALGNGEYEVNLSLEGKQNGNEEVRLYHNGHRIPGSPPYRIKAVEGKNRLRASAFNSDKTVESKPARLTFVSDVPPQPTTLHIFAAAVNDYPNPLDFAVPDAKSFTQAFEPGLYDKINRVTLLDKDAGKAQITEALSKIDCQPQDTLLVFLAGHGTIIDNKFHYLPYGSDGTSSEQALSSRELGDILSKLPATRQVLFLDTCHAGASAKDLADLLVEKKGSMTSTSRGASFVRDQKILARRAGTFLVAGSTPEATAAEVPELGHGIFTYAVLEGLKEKSSAADQKITVNELLRYLNEAVPELSMKFRGTPHGIWQFSAGQDFPIAKP